LKSDTAAEKSKDQLSRDFSGRSIFDFCNNICHDRKWPGVIHRLVGDNEWPLSAATGRDQRSMRRARSIRASTFGNMRMTGKAVLGSAMAFWRNERLMYQRVLVVCSLFHHRNTYWPFQRHVV
jgi:hypothetical protein